MRVRVLPCSGMYKHFFLIYQGVCYVQNVWLSHNTGQPCITPTDGLSSFFRTILAKDVEGEPKIQSLKLSPRKGDRTRNLCIVVRCLHHNTKALWNLVRRHHLAVSVVTEERYLFSLYLKCFCMKSASFE